MSDHLQLKDHYNESRIFSHRVWFVFAVVIFLMGLLVYRYYDLQITDYQDYATQSDRNRIQVQALPPTRGLIYDRNGVLLADNRPSYTLTIVKERVNDIDETLALIGSLIEVSEADLERFQKNLAQRRRPFEPVLLRSELNEEEIARFAVNEFRLPGVEVEAQLVRYYPFGEAFAHTVGYVSRINAEELSGFSEEQYERYRGTNAIGKIGIEKQYEEMLLGTVGYRNVETDARGRVLRELERFDPLPGQDLHLYVDAKVQAAAIEAMQDLRGAIVVVEVETGGVIAIVSNPGFDPNLFVTGISSKDYRALNESTENPLFNRALQGAYEPGSTLKPMLGLAGLEAGVITPHTTINDPGFFQLPGVKRRFRDHISWGHGKAVDLKQAIIESCNTYFFNLVNEMTIDKVVPFGRQFGLGEKTEIDIPSEGSGIWPSPQWKREKRGLSWGLGDTLNVGIGQGDVLLTPAQLAVMTATMASRGKRPKLKVVQPKWQSDLLLMDQVVAKPKNIVVAKDENWNYVLAAMEQVVHHPKGTARSISKDLDYRMAAKTGTAQSISIGQDEKYKEDELAERYRDDALIVAYAPADKPKVAISVIVENKGHGGEIAAPIARKVLDTYYRVELEREKLLSTEAE